MRVIHNLTHLTDDQAINPDLGELSVYVEGDSERLVVDCSLPRDDKPSRAIENPSTGPRVWIERLEGRYRLYVHPADHGDGGPQDAVLTVELRDDGTGSVEGHGIEPPKVIKR